MENAVTGMSSAITALGNTVTADALWGVFTDALPFVGIVVVVAFGFYIVRKLIKGVSKGKARI